MSLNSPVFRPGPGFKWLEGAVSRVILRRNPRALSVRMRMTPEHMLYITSSSTLTRDSVERMLREKKDWILAASQKLRDSAKANPEVSDEFPASINLRAIGQKWTVHYRVSDDSLHRIQPEPGHVLVISQPIKHAATVARLLQHFLVAYAKHYLPLWLEDAAKQTGKSYERVSIRRQKSRWGSCSGKGNISLNAGLLFLEPHLVKYILIHELCHTVEMNHGDAYWRLVSVHQPDYEDCEKQMKNAYIRYVPRWLRR